MKSGHGGRSWRATLAIVALSVVAGESLAAAAPTPPALSPRVVIAIVDSGVNVYHDDFSRPRSTTHPSEVVPGYPRSAKPLRLALETRSYEEAVEADDETWRTLRPGALHYVPGTNVAGLVYLPGSPLDGGQRVGTDMTEPRPFIDDYQYHGTGVASVLAGARFGACPDCLVVVVNADDKEEGYAWAAQQPWIDIISNSWGGVLGAPSRATAGNPQRATAADAQFSRVAAEKGKVVLFGSGNGATGLGGIAPGPTQHGDTYWSPFAGPPWVLAVGAAKLNGQPTNWHDIPVDLISHGEQWPAAADRTIDGSGVFLGTSCATPIAAGVIGQALLNARRATGDRATGPRPGGSLVVPARGRRPTRGPLADGRLSRREVVDTARAVSAWQPFDPSTLTTDPLVTPTTELSYAYQGFGLLDAPKIPVLTQVLLGQVPMPARPEMAQWAASHSQRRAARWGADPAAGS